MPLTPDVQQIINGFAALGPQPEPGTVSPQQMRLMAAQTWNKSGPFQPVADVYERMIPGPGGELRVRVYVPEGSGPFPLLVWFHGGGWVIGTLYENEGACRALCRLAEAVVMSVEYRLAPEHPFPAAAEDAFAAVCWAAEHGEELRADPGRIAVAGESAGGNLAAVCALKARDTGAVRLALQILLAPVLGAPQDGRPSYTDFADGYFLSRASMEFFFDQYPRSTADLREAYLLPLAAEDLRGLTPALVMTAECDVLRDEGEEYAHRLTEAGVPCELVRYDGQIHGFFGLLDDQLAVSAEAHATAAAALRHAFGDP
ncbi:MAG: alpha/beta hydrolase [Jatrophihabitantaceae bacterium]